MAVKGLKHFHCWSGGPCSPFQGGSSTCFLFLPRIFQYDSKRLSCVYIKIGTRKTKQRKKNKTRDKNFHICSCWRSNRKRAFIAVARSASRWVVDFGIYITKFRGSWNHSEAGDLGGSVCDPVGVSRKEMDTSGGKLGHQHCSLHPFRWQKTRLTSGLLAVSVIDPPDWVYNDG